MAERDGRQENANPASRRSFGDLSPREIFALAIHIEQANTRRFRAFADVFRGYDEEVARRFEELAREEENHEWQLTEEFRRHFGESIPALDESDVDGVIESPDLDDAEHQIFDSLAPLRVYELGLQAEQEARAFYLRAAAACQDPQLASFYRDFADMENDHAAWFEQKIRAAKAGGGEA